MIPAKGAALIIAPVPALRFAILSFAARLGDHTTQPPAPKRNPLQLDTTFLQKFGPPLSLLLCSYWEALGLAQNVTTGHFTS